MKLETVTSHRVQLVPQDQSVELNGVVVQNPDLYSWLSGFEPHQMEPEIARLLVVGVLVIRHVNTAFELDFVERRVQDLLNETEDKLQKTAQEGIRLVSEKFDPEQAKSFTRAILDLVQQTRQKLDQQVDGLKELFSKERERFDPKRTDGYPAAFQAVIDRTVKDLASMFDPDNKKSVISQFGEQLTEIFGGNGRDGRIAVVLDEKLQPLRDQILELRVKVEARHEVEEAVAKSSQHGFDFEDLVEGRLAIIAAPYGDTVKYVGQTSQGKSKSGDFTVDLNGRGKSIAVEARSRRSSLPMIRKALSDAMEVRGADFGLYIAESADLLPKDVGGFNVYDNCQIVTDYANLETAYRVARVILGFAKSGSEGVDVTTIQLKLQEIQSLAKQLRTIKSKGTQVTNLAGDIKSSADQIETAVLSVVEEIEDLLNDAETKA